MTGPMGWIPYEQRTLQQRAFTDAFGASKGRFQDRIPQEVEVPDRIILQDLERKATGGDLISRIWQTTGSCVGAGGARAYTQAICGDIVIRGDIESPKFPFPYATYGVGREIAFGPGEGKGDGSFGAAQAEACKDTVFGILPWDDERVPKPRVIQDGNHSPWVKWTEQQEYQWSIPKAWPISRTELEADAKGYGFADVAIAKSLEEIDQGLARGMGVTIASAFGTKPRVEQGYLIGRWNDTWYHQMTIEGRLVTTEHGVIYVQGNQWGPTIHGDCPYLKPLGIRGCYWLLARDLESNIAKRGTECFIHSGSGGFDAERVFDWGNMGISYE